MEDKAGQYDARTCSPAMAAAVQSAICWAFQCVARRMHKDGWLSIASMMMIPQAAQDFSAILNVPL
jgi:hypothetical protein